MNNQQLTKCQSPHSHKLLITLGAITLGAHTRLHVLQRCALAGGLWLSEEVRRRTAAARQPGGAAAENGLSVHH